MLTQEMKDTVEKQRLGFVATVSDAGEPNVSPKGTFVGTPTARAAETVLAGFVAA